MKIAVLIKEVPDMDTVRFDREAGRVDRASAGTEMNPFDLYALQAAVDIKQQYGALGYGGDQGVDITAICMGPPKAQRTLRSAFARGADQVVLASDPKFGGSDTWATALILSATLRALGGFDLILCGEKSVDGDTAQVGAEVAEILGIPHSYWVEKISAVLPDAIEVHSSGICGVDQIRRMAFPALAAVTKNCCVPHLPTIHRKLASLEIPVTVLNYESLSPYLDGRPVGGKGSPTQVVRIEIPPEVHRTGIFYRETPAPFIEATVVALRKQRLL